MRFERSRKHMIDFIFPLTLLLVFAVSALIVLLLSARIYAAQTEQADKNYQTTTPLSYITENFAQMTHTALYLSRNVKAGNVLLSTCRLILLLIITKIQILPAIQHISIQMAGG